MSEDKLRGYREESPEKRRLHNFTFDSLRKSFTAMGSSRDMYDIINRSKQRGHEYTKEEISEVIRSGNLSSLREMSRDFFNNSGIYRRLLVYYATILQYTGILIPHKKNPLRKVNAKDYDSFYSKAMNFLDRSNAAALCNDFALKVLIDGTYYGVVSNVDDEGLVVINLPFEYCRTRFKDIYNLPLIEFNLNYFGSMEQDDFRKQAFKSYPKEIQRAYRRWESGKLENPWFLIPQEISICFKLFDGIPFFINTLSTVVDYGEYRELEKERDKGELKKILVNKVPHLPSTGELLFEPDEAEEIHKGVVNMVKRNKNLDVLTTYGEVTVESLTDARQTINNNLDKIEKSIFTEAGTTKQLFAAEGNLSLNISLRNDLSLMMVLAGQFSLFFQNLMNNRFATNKLDLTYEILPISYYNYEDFIKEAFKLATSGYSLFLPALGFNISQRNLIDLKYLETDVLELHEKLIPLQSSYTATATASAKGLGDGAGRPSLPDSEKSDKTLANERALESGGESSGGEA